MALHRIAHLVIPEQHRRVSVSESHLIPQWAVSPGFAVENVEILGAVNMLNDLDGAVQELMFAEAGVRAAKLGYEAILVTPFKDYGVRLMRSVVDIPVIGGGQSAMQIAVGLGRRFGLVTVYPTMLRDLYESHIAYCGFNGHCSGVYFASEESQLAGLMGQDGEIHEMGRSKRGALLERVVAAARRAIAGGAEVIVLGCTCMTPIRAELESRLDGVPVVDPLVSGYKLAELAVTLGWKYPHKEPSLQASRLHAMLSASLLSEANSGAACGDSCALISEDQEVVEAS